MELLLKYISLLEIQVVKSSVKEVLVLVNVAKS